jgi:cystathionine beta-lyase/cystathionine gamma-synthase
VGSGDPAGNQAVLPGNAIQPLTEIADISKLVAIAHAKGILVAVDNCFCTPILQKPLELGADLVIHSATKYIDGQGGCSVARCAGRRS